MIDYVAPTPNVFLRPSHLHQGIIGEAFDLVCSIALSSTTKMRPVGLTWNFTGNDTRVRVIPTTITTDDSIGIIYTTVIQFDYVIREDEGNYSCSLAIDGDLEESTFSLETISKHIILVMLLKNAADVSGFAGLTLNSLQIIIPSQHVAIPFVKEINLQA